MRLRVMQDFPTDRVILKQEEYLSGALQKALAQQSSIHYYQEASEVSLWDGTKISLRGSYEEQGLKLSVNGLEILLVTDRCQVTKESWWDADVIVAEDLPQKAAACFSRFSWFFPWRIWGRQSWRRKIGRMQTVPMLRKAKGI